MYNTLVCVCCHCCCFITVVHFYALYVTTVIGYSAMDLKALHIYLGINNFKHMRA